MYRKRAKPAIPRLGGCRVCVRVCERVRESVCVCVFVCAIVWSCMRSYGVCECLCVCRAWSCGPKPEKTFRAIHVPISLWGLPFQTCSGSLDLMSACSKDCMAWPAQSLPLLQGRRLEQNSARHCSVLPQSHVPHPGAYDDGDHVSVRQLVAGKLRSRAACALLATAANVAVVSGAVVTEPGSQPDLPLQVCCEGFAWASAVSIKLSERGVPSTIFEGDPVFMLMEASSEFEKTLPIIRRRTAVVELWSGVGRIARSGKRWADTCFTFDRAELEWQGSPNP